MASSTFEDEKVNVQNLLSDALESYAIRNYIGVREHEQARDFLPLLTDERVRLCINCFLPYIARNEDDVCCSGKRCQEAFKEGKYSELLPPFQEEADAFRRHILEQAKKRKLKAKETHDCVRMRKK